MKISGISYVNSHKKKYRNGKRSSYISILFIIVLFVIIVISVREGWKLAHPPHIIPTGIDSKQFDTMSEVTFKDKKSELLLKGWLFKSKSPKNWIILSHDYGSNRMIFADKTPILIRECLERDFNVLTFDYRNSGLSSGEISTLGYLEKQDLLGAIDFAKKNDGQNIIILGLCMGASTALSTMADDPGMITALISDSCYSDLKKYLYYYLPEKTNLPTFPFSMLTIPLSSFFTGVDIGDIKPIKSIEKIVAEKIMLIHSEDDQIVPYADSLELFEQSDSSAVYWVIKKSNHGKIFENYPNEYIDRIFTFINKKLPK